MLLFSLSLFGLQLEAFLVKAAFLEKNEF